MVIDNINKMNSSNQPILLASKISKQVPLTELGQNERLTIIDNVDFKLNQEDTVAITGASGSGKSTLLALLAGLDTPTSGTITFNQTEIHHLTEEEKALLRLKSIGFIFQSFQLIPTLTALQNVTIPLKLQVMERLLRKEEIADIDAMAIELLDKVGLGSRLHHQPTQLSGGEQQRVAIVRAIIHKPMMLFADEPTGNLDQKRGHQICDLLFSDQLWLTHRPAIVMVTHDPSVASRCHKQYEMIDGRLVS